MSRRQIVFVLSTNDAGSHFPSLQAFHDLRWQEFLDDATRERVCAHPTVTTFPQDYGLTMLADGLTLEANRLRAQVVRTDISEGTR